MCLCMVFFFLSGDSRHIARPATHHQAPSGLFTRAATALGPTSSGTADSAPTPAAARPIKPQRLTWPSSARPVESYRDLWWWSSLVFVTTSAPMHLTVTLLCGATGLDRPVGALIPSEEEDLTDSGAEQCEKHDQVDPHRRPLINGPWKRKCIFVDKNCDWVWMNIDLHTCTISFCTSTQYLL